MKQTKYIFMLYIIHHAGDAVDLLIENDGSVAQVDNIVGSVLHEVSYRGNCCILNTNLGRIAIFSIDKILKL